MIDYNRIMHVILIDTFVLCSTGFVKRKKTHCVFHKGKAKNKSYQGTHTYRL